MKLIEAYPVEIGIIQYLNENAYINYNLARMGFDIEVIGNIHDNPELLEG